MPSTAYRRAPARATGRRLRRVADARRPSRGAGRRYAVARVDAPDGYRTATAYRSWCRPRYVSASVVKRLSPNRFSEPDPGVERLSIADAGPKVEALRSRTAQSIVAELGREPATATDLADRSTRRCRTSDTTSHGSGTPAS